MQTDHNYTLLNRERMEKKRNPSGTTRRGQRSQVKKITATIKAKMSRTPLRQLLQRTDALGS